MGVSLEESTTENVPPVLEAIVKNMKFQNKSPDSIQKDCLFILLIVAMIENGFEPFDEECEIQDVNAINAELFTKWKSQTGVYEVQFIMVGFNNTSVTLIMSPLGAMALVNVVIKDFEAETYTVCLPVSKYVVAPQATTIPMIFRDLKHLSMVLKNKVLSAVKSRILDHYGYASASLVGLPEELLFKILYYIPVEAIVNVSKTCMRLRELLRDDRFWHDIAKRDFASVINLQVSTGNVEWKALYINSYNKQRDENILNQTIEDAVYEHMNDTDFVYYPFWHI